MTRLEEIKMLEVKSIKYSEYYGTEVVFKSVPYTDDSYFASYITNEMRQSQYFADPDRYTSQKYWNIYGRLSEIVFERKLRLRAYTCNGVENERPSKIYGAPMYITEEEANIIRTKILEYHGNNNERLLQM